MTALIIAAQEGNKECVKLLIEGKARLTMKDKVCNCVILFFFFFFVIIEW